MLTSPLSDPTMSVKSGEGCERSWGARCGDRELPFVATEHGKALDYMRRIKVALDPQGILNPEKMLPG